MYFSATIFSLLGFYSPTLTSLSIAVTNFVCTLIALLIIDTVGRRRILLLSIPVMVIGLLACSIAYECFGRPNWAAQPFDVAADGNLRGPWAIVILVAMVVYVCGYAIGLGNIAWQQSELFPLSVRSLGSGLATATNCCKRSLVFVSLYLFIRLLHSLLKTYTVFSIYSFLCTGTSISTW